MKAYLAIYLGLIFSGSFAGNVIIENKSFDELKAMSKAANKNLYIDVYTTWCGPCKMMEKETFLQPEVQKAFAKDYIAAKIDLETPNGTLLGTLFQIESIPTSLFFNVEGELLGIYKGAYLKEKFMPLLQLHANNQVSLDKKLAMMKYSLEHPNGVGNFLTYWYESGTMNDAKLEQFIFELKPSVFVAKSTQDTLLDFVSTKTKKLFDYYLNKTAELNKSLGVIYSDTLIRNLNEDYLIVLLVDGKANLKFKLAEVETFRKKYPKEKYIGNLLNAYAYQMETNKTIFVKELKIFDSIVIVPMMHVERHSKYIDLANNLLQGHNDKKVVNLVIDWLRKANKIKTTYTSYYLMAYAYYVLSDLKQSDRHALMAIAQAKK
ncbi:MAG: DUF255 domain-containing protein [Bacteroidetes bacterium]|nr:MAG: DUF255 domain-containing protein [Bacteroidota bacterium]